MSQNWRFLTPSPHFFVFFLSKICDFFPPPPPTSIVYIHTLEYNYNNGILAILSTRSRGYEVNITILEGRRRGIPTVCPKIVVHFHRVSTHYTTPPPLLRKVFCIMHTYHLIYFLLNKLIAGSD